MQNMQNEGNKKVTGTRRPAVCKTNDIIIMEKVLREARIFDFIPGREYNAFPGFKDPFSHIKVGELHKWLTDNKERLSYEII